MVTTPPKSLYGNYQYSLTSEQQSAIQLFLRLLPQSAQMTAEWALLHKLTYTLDWSEKPRFAEQANNPDCFCDEAEQQAVSNG